MRILVLLSSYNGERYIERQIDSILNQTVRDSLHITIRDDGSKDNTCSIVNELKARYPGKIDLIQGKNVGFNASFFELLKSASGYDYYAFSDQDDVWLDSKLEIAVKTLEQEEFHGPMLYASTSYLVRDDLKPYGQTRRKRRAFSIYNTIIQNICPGHTQVMNQSLLDLVTQKPIEPDNLYAYDSWVMCYATLYGKVLFDNRSFTYYRQHEKNQQGSGGNWIGQLAASARHNLEGDNLKYRKQIRYFIEQNKEKLVEIGAYAELSVLITEKDFLRRVRYILRSKLYRQSLLETIAWKTAYATGLF